MRVLTNHKVDNGNTFLQIYILNMNAHMSMRTTDISFHAFTEVIYKKKNINNR